MKMNVYIHPYVYFQVYMYNIHFVVKLWGFTWMCIKEKAFYHFKFQLQALGSCNNLPPSVLYPLARNLKKQRGDLWDRKFVVSSSKKIGKILERLTSMQVLISDDTEIHVVPQKLASVYFIYLFQVYVFFLLCVFNVFNLRSIG